MRSALARGPLADALRWREGRIADPSELLAAHDAGYLESLREACETGQRLTGTTVVGPGSWRAALAAAGTALAAGAAVAAGETTRALALVRPPGHHAGRAMADGYCVFNHVALCAEQALAAGARRVAIVDWDVHHGNGTQSIFYERGDVLTISLHMRHGAWGPSHRESGGPAEVGAGGGAGRNVNVELPLGTGDEGYLAAFDAVVAPIVREHAPDVLIGACGQDASQFDPNGRQSVTMAGFHGIGERIASLARECTGGRLLLCQEGGYARTYAAFCLLATLEGVLGRPCSRDPLAFLPDDPGRATAAIEAVRAAQRAHWHCLGGV
jgi:acetoin utilization deacetylase AcuC-like enzyme